jgi:hypothetical protein
MAHLLDVTKKQRGIYIALIFKQRFHRFIKVRGNTVPDRILVTAKNIFKFSAFAMISQKEERSKSLISKVLVDWGDMDMMARFIREHAIAVKLITGNCQRNLGNIRTKKDILKNREWYI